MSINWVMLDGSEVFVRLPGEKPIFKSSPRTSFLLSTPRAYPAHNPINFHSADGTLYLTNQRVVYLPKTPTADFKSFSASLLNLHDTHITVPWFGPNSWQAMVQPVPGGNIPAGHAAIELKLTFKEGGAPDFHSNFERIRERLQQVMETARDSNIDSTRSGAPFNGINLEAVHLDELPSYQDSGHDRVAADLSSSQRVEPAGSSTIVSDARREDHFTTNNPPLDAPPGYEEAQQQSIQAEMDRRLSSP